MEQWSPTFLAPGISFVEDNFPTDSGWQEVVWGWFKSIIFTVLFISIFLKLFLTEGWLLYNIGLISAIHQHELAIDVHMFPLSWTSFPRYIFKTNFEKELHASLENTATLWTTWIIFVSLPPHLSVLCWKAAFLGSICFIFFPNLSNPHSVSPPEMSSMFFNHQPVLMAENPENSLYSKKAWLWLQAQWKPDQLSTWEPVRVQDTDFVIKGIEVLL